MNSFLQTIIAIAIINSLFVFSNLFRFGFKIEELNGERKKKSVVSQILLTPTHLDWA